MPTGTRKKADRKTQRPNKVRKATWNTLPTNGVIVITGHRGEGKSALAWWLAEETKKKILSKFRKRAQIAAFGIPTETQKVFPKRLRIKHIDTLEEVSELKDGSIVIVDESSFVAHARRAMNDNNIKWLQLINISRHKDFLFIFIAQDNKQLDVQILGSADYVIMKRPTELHLEFSRPQFKNQLVNAYNLFDRMRGDTRKKAYIANYHKTAESNFLNCKMPSWWNDKVSKSYSAFVFKKE